MAAIGGSMVNTKKESNIEAWKLRTEKAKKGELLRELQKLRVQVVAMEREKVTHMYSKRNDFRHDFQQLEEIETKDTDNRKLEQVKLKQQLEKIDHMVKRFHKELRDVKPTPEFVEKLKIIMEEIEGTINAFKDQQRKLYEELLLEERTTNQEILALERKFEAWSQLGPAVTHRTTVPQVPLASARDITKDLPPEVATFEKFLEQTGGMRGGWDEYDHQTFLKFRQRHKAKSVFIQNCLRGIPTRTEEEIREHEEWYQTYLDLNEKKKESIKRWREKKQEEKEDILSQADGKAIVVEEETGKKEELKKQIEAEKRERFSKLNAWKVQKEIERAEAEERKLREELDKSKKNEDEKQKQLKVKAKVDEYKKQKAEEEAFQQLQQEIYEQEQTARQKQISAREISRFRERDKKLTEKKVEQEKTKKQQEEEKQKRLEKLKSQVEVEVERDRNRLLLPTANWKSRAKEVGPSGPGQVYHMPHRAVPAWRQNLN